MLTSNTFTLKAASLAALAITASCATIPTDNNLWEVPKRLDPSTADFQWTQLPANAVAVDVASDDGRTFSHYPFIYNVGGTLYLLFSASANDVDGMGQDVRIAKSVDSGVTWSTPEVAFPAALQPNQTVETSEYWCNLGDAQRALQPLTIAFLPSSDESYRVFAVAQSSDNTCPGTYESAGRLARELDVGGSDLFSSDPCWIETNDYTTSHLWPATVYGTEYGMKVCDDKDAIVEAINKPDNLGPVSTDMYITGPVIASDGEHNVTYPTKAVWVGEYDNGYWQRFWSDVSNTNSTGSAWVEYSTDENGTSWYPYTTSGSDIVETNIYQEATKAHFGAFEGSEQLRYYVSNGGLSASGDQIILTVATSRGNATTFSEIGIVRGGDAGSDVSAGTRPAVNNGLPGFYWPSAAEVGDKLAVAYSENRQTIWVSVINMSDLP